MSVGQRLRDFWASVRPRTRRGGILAAVAILGGAAALSIVLFVGIAMAWNPYVDYTLNSDVNARQWAALPLSYTASSTCAKCHAEQQAHLTSASHKGIGCQSCHGAPARACRGGRQGHGRTGRGPRAGGRGLPPLPQPRPRAVRPGSARSCRASTTSRRASSATTPTRASPTGRRSCSTRSRTCRPASRAMARTASRPGTSATPRVPRTTSAASSVTPPVAGPPNAEDAQPQVSP